MYLEGEKRLNPLVLLVLLSHIHLQLGYHDATCRFVSYSISSYFSHGVLAWIVTASAISKLCSTDFPCQNSASLVHWDDFSVDLVLSRVADQMRYTQLQRGLISWRQVYMVRSGICLFGLIFLYHVCQTPMLVMLGWLWWPVLTYVLILELVLRLIKGFDVEYCCSCHACTNIKP